MKRTVWIGLSFGILLLCSVAAFAAPQPVSEAQGLDQLRQQIFSPASASSGSTSEDLPAVGAPAPRFLTDDPCEDATGPCLYWICRCSMVICAGCGAQTIICPNPGPTTCICNPPC